jgi:hypothetical protein
MSNFLNIFLTSTSLSLPLPSLPILNRSPFGSFHSSPSCRPWASSAEPAESKIDLRRLGAREMDAMDEGGRLVLDLEEISSSGSGEMDTGERTEPVARRGGCEELGRYVSSTRG